MIDQVITTPPTAPSSSDATTFRTRADAFIAWIVVFVSQIIGFINQVNTLETNVNAKEASAVAASNIAVALANYKGIFVQGVSSALVGESWSYSGVNYRCAVDTANNPITEPASWVSLAIDATIHAAPAETPGDTDEFGFWDSFSLQLRKVTFANFRAALRTSFDTVYAVLNSPAFTGNPTATTQASTDNSTRLATTAWAKLGLVYSLGVNGYIKFPTWMGGLIIQWGQTAVITNNTYLNVTLPITLPTAVLTTQTSPYITTGADTVGDAMCKTISCSTTTLRVEMDDTTGISGCRFLVIGY
ncbi:gp53-like domain-containing protein [Sulfuricurvum sp.]|uniref:gp53-like domain-containing protein n=1 Tax=Sulfuricurvum sp. TaxID=2025608 RepID=UPI003BB20910